MHTTFRHAWTHFYFLLLSNFCIWWFCQQQELFTLTLSTAGLFFCAFSGIDSWHCRKRGSSPCWCISGSCSLITIFPLRKIFLLVEILGSMGILSFPFILPSFPLSSSDCVVNFLLILSSLELTSCTPRVPVLTCSSTLPLKCCSVVKHPCRKAQESFLWRTLK